MESTLNRKDSFEHNYVGLRHRIMQLNSQKEDKEEIIKHNLRELYYSMHLASLMKQSLHNVYDDPQIQATVKRAGIVTFVDYAIGRLFRRSKSFKGFLFSMILEKFANYILYHPEAIYNGINRVRDIYNKKIKTDK